MGTNYDNMTTDDFDRYLLAELAKLSPAQILAIPGIYEVLSEELNNEVLDAWEADQEDPDTCPVCGEPTPDGTGCTNPECTIGEQNLADDRADHQYHAAADRATMAYYLEHDR